MITAQATMSRSSSSRTRQPPDTCDSPVTERGDTSLVPNLTACSIAARVSSAPETPPGKTEVRGIQLTGLSRGHGRAVAAGRQALPEVDRRVPVATHRAWTAPEQHAPGAPLT